MSGGRKAIIRRLGHIGVGIGADMMILPFGMPAKLERPIHQHLIGIHINRGACPALNGVYDELIMPLSGYHFISRPLQCIGNPRIKPLRLLVRSGGGLLHNGHGANKLIMQAISGDRKIVRGTQRLNTVVGIKRNSLLAKKISLGSRYTHAPHPHSSKHQ
ncbi:hypothetical protein D3C75_853890 [compost metagenome]